MPTHDHDGATNQLTCDDCDHGTTVADAIGWEHEARCPECGGTMTPEPIGTCDRCGRPFTPADRQYVAVGNDDGNWFAERDPTEIPRGFVLHEDCILIEDVLAALGEAGD